MDQISNDKVTVKIKNEIHYLTVLGCLHFLKSYSKPNFLTGDAKTLPQQRAWRSRRSVSLWRLHAIHRLCGCTYVIWWRWKEPLAFIRFSRTHLIPKRLGSTYKCSSLVLKISHVSAMISFLQEKYSSSESILCPSWLRESPWPVRHISVQAPSYSKAAWEPVLHCSPLVATVRTAATAPGRGNWGVQVALDDT